MAGVLLQGWYEMTDRRILITGSREAGIPVVELGMVE